MPAEGDGMTIMGIPVENLEVPCRFGDNDAAVGRYETPEGCACFPDDRVQDLCGQHVIQDGMIGDSKLTKIYRPGFYAWYLGISVGPNDAR
jgi:hypothetical protein